MNHTIKPIKIKLPSFINLYLILAISSTIPKRIAAYFIKVFRNDTNFFLIDWITIIRNYDLTSKGSFNHFSDLCLCPLPCIDFDISSH